jgi:alpha-1,3-glucan synthase
MFRIGQQDNPMVFPWTANYTRDLLHKNHATGDLYVSPRAPGADKFRYSTNWGSSWSNWSDYTSGNTTLIRQPWSGTKEQEWEGDHVILNFWSAMTASSEHIQHADLGREDRPPRRWPHAYLEGPWNQYGYDGGLPNEMTMDSEGLWMFDLVAEWPTELIVNVWGVNPDGYPDKSAAYGDVDGDGVLDWVPPDSLARNVIEVPDIPSKKHLGYKVLVNDGNFSYRFVPVGSSATQAILAILIGLIPLFTAALGIWTFMISFYHVKFNEIGISVKGGFLGIALSKLPDKEKVRNAVTGAFNYSTASVAPAPPRTASVAAIDVEAGSPERRTVLIATMEYEIEDWDIKIKIGGLGVMSSLMGKNLGHQDLIWVVPCVGGFEYPTDMSKLDPFSQHFWGTYQTILWHSRCQRKVPLG